MSIIVPPEGGYQVGINTGIAGAAGGNIFDPTAMGGVGLGFRRISGGWDFIQPGSPLDAYGVSANSVAGWVYPLGIFGVVNMVPVSTSFTANTGQVITRLQIGTTQYLTIQHDYSFVPANPNVLRVTVTITNLSGLSQEVKYRHICDVDVDPTSLGDQVVFPATAFPTDLLAVSFARWTQPEHPSPLVPFTNLVSPLGGTFPSPITTDDLGWAFDLNFGMLAAGATRVRTFYYAANQPGQSEANLVAQLQALGRTYIVRAHDRLGSMPSANTACLALGAAPCCPCGGTTITLQCGTGQTLPATLFATIVGRGDCTPLTGLVIPMTFRIEPVLGRVWMHEPVLVPGLGGGMFFRVILGDCFQHTEGTVLPTACGGLGLYVQAYAPSGFPSIPFVLSPVTTFGCSFAPLFLQATFLVEHFSAPAICGHEGIDVTFTQ